MRLKVIQRSYSGMWVKREAHSVLPIFVASKTLSANLGHLVDFAKIYVKWINSINE